VRNENAAAHTGRRAGAKLVFGGGGGVVGSAPRQDRTRDFYVMI
jgi:hypothetical protein